MKKICEVCGKEFEKQGYNQKYCSPECERTGKNAVRRKRRLATRKIPLTKVCEICGKEFKPINYIQKYCSPECSEIGKNQQLKFEPLKSSVSKKIFAPEEELFVRIMWLNEEYNFKNLRQAVNFLTAYTDIDTAECLDLLRQRENKIGHWKIFYD